VDEVRRSDDRELCGYVDERDGGWRALTVFGAVLGDHDTRSGAEHQVLQEGLASLAERWTLRDASGVEEIVCIQEANAASVTLLLGYYPDLGVPTLKISASQLASGEWALHR
jgi:hypothetical protein